MATIEISMKEVLGAMFPEEDRKKSTKLSDQFREEGNKHFTKFQFLEALVKYNRSLCQALPGSKQMGLAFGNRSAVYFETKMFQKCLDNIQLARINGYPTDKLARLDEREDKCKTLMTTENDKDGQQWNFFQLSHPANQKIPFIVDCLQMRHDDKFGRHIITTKNLKSGNIIAIEEPFFKCIDPKVRYSRCSNCLKTNMLNLIPCEKCANAMYCTLKCKKEYAISIHNYECTKVPFAPYIRTPIKQIMQSVACAGSFVTLHELLIDSTPRTVFDCDLNNPEDSSYQKQLLQVVHSLATTRNERTKMLKSVKPSNIYDLPMLNILQRTPSEQDFTMKLFQKQLSLHDTNQFEMQEHSRELKSDSLKVIFDQKIGTGLFPFASLINHSCEANLKRATVDNKMAIIVARPIKAGEQIFISYGYSHYKYSREKRHEALKFVCKCNACVKNYPEMMKMTRKDDTFKDPEFTLVPVQAAIEQFKKNCEYIDQNIKNYPCFEIAMLGEHNAHLLHQIAMVCFD